MPSKEGMVKKDEKEEIKETSNGMKERGGKEESERSQGMLDHAMQADMDDGEGKNEQGREWTRSRKGWTICTSGRNNKSYEEVIE